MIDATVVGSVHPVPPVPIGRAGGPAEGAGAVYLFCLPESDHVSGQVPACGGGFGG